MGKKTSSKRVIFKAKYLGDFILFPFSFKGIDEITQGFQSKEFKQLNDKQKHDQVGRALLGLILDAPGDVFLLATVIEFIDQIARNKILSKYSFSSFELWLNHFSGLSAEDNYHVRGKIVGKRIPRDEYQILFPIGMGRVHPGSHYVTAHASPDLDTTIASFWGWVDAFGARVSEGLHIWNIPGGAPPSSIEVALLFQHIFGQNVFTHLTKTRMTLALSSLDLMSQVGLALQRTDQSSLAIDHERAQKAIVLVDDKGFFLGDWRSFDVEGVRQVIMLLNNCLRWFENNLHVNIISLFAKEKLTLKDLPAFSSSVFEIKIKDCDPAKEFTDKQKRHMETYLQRVLKVKKGLEATFKEFAKGIQNLNLPNFQECIERVNALSKSELFDSHGNLVENRPKIFHYLEDIISTLDRAIIGVRTYTERLDVALDIKTSVFGYLPQVVNYRANVDELKSKMGNYPYLTVTSSDESGKMLPLGVVRSIDLRNPILGTVTLRDFCNRDETKIPSYFEVISVIDHHKANLNTSTVPVAYISDAQSSNAIVAELAFAINDKYSTGGMSLEEIEAQIEKVKKDLKSPSSKRIFQRLLKRHDVALHQSKDKTTYYVDPLREFVEYLQFLYAILDDTDLLTKVSKRDIDCVTSLLNRLKSLMDGQEREIIILDDITRDATYVAKAANRILQHSDMYSLYRKIYMAKEQLIEENFELGATGKPSSVFVDTKLQNGCCRVGQTKLFANNFASYEKHAAKLRAHWVKESQDFFKDRREIDLYLHMTSTIAGAEDLFSGAGKEYDHKDELWIWIPMTDQSIEHLKGFLNNLRASPQIHENEGGLKVEFLGDNAKELAKIFQESFLPIPQILPEKKGKGLPIAILRYRAGTINSRKAMISPYLPKLIS